MKHITLISILNGTSGKFTTANGGKKTDLKTFDQEEEAYAYFYDTLIGIWQEMGLFDQ